MPGIFVEHGGQDIRLMSTPDLRYVSSPIRVTVGTTMAPKAQGWSAELTRTVALKDGTSLHTLAYARASRNRERLGRDHEDGI